MRSPGKQEGDRRTNARRGGVAERRTDVVRGAVGERRVVEQRGMATAMCDALEDILQWERSSEGKLPIGSVN